MRFENCPTSAQVAYSSWRLKQLSNINSRVLTTGFRRTRTYYFQSVPKAISLLSDCARSDHFPSRSMFLNYPPPWMVRRSRSCQFSSPQPIDLALLLHPWEADCLRWEVGVDLGLAVVCSIGSFGLTPERSVYIASVHTPGLFLLDHPKSVWVRLYTVARMHFNKMTYGRQRINKYPIDM